MSDGAAPVESDVTESAPAAEPAPAAEADKDWAAEAAKWKALARKHEDNAKSVLAKAKQFDEITESQKSELQKITERAEAAERRAAEVETRALRAEVAAETGVPANLLHGGTREELEASAKAVLAFKGKPDFGGGNRGSDTKKSDQLTQADLKRMTPEQIVKAQAEGRLNDLMGVR